MDQPLQSVIPSSNIQTPRVFQPNQPVINPADGKNYNVKQQVPGKGVTLTDPLTQQEMMVSEIDSRNLQPALRTSKKISVEDLAREIVADLTGEELPIIETPVYQPEKKMSTVKNRWMDTRRLLKTQRETLASEQSDHPTYNEHRQVRAIRELHINKEGAVFNPYRGKADDTGHDEKTGLPMSETKEIEVGMTEFPYGVDKNKDPEGYAAMTMEQMDEKFEEEHSHFKNERKLPQQTMMREEDDDYFTGQERLNKRKKDEADAPKPRYSGEDDEELAKSLATTAADRVMGEPIGGEPETTETKELPVQFKDIQKAPGKSIGYEEPTVLENANPDIKAAIELLKNTQQDIERIQTDIKNKTEPLQKAITDATSGLQIELAKNAALLKTCFDMIHTELNKTSDKVAVVEDSIYAAIDREKAVAPPASLAQILKKADETDAKVAAEIRKIKALVESSTTEMVLEQFVYKYPISEVQKKKVQAALEDGDIESIVQELIGALKSLQDTNERI
jgi:hypothetical protein